MLLDSYICEILEKAKIRPQMIDGWGQGLKERTDYKTERGSFQGDGNVLYLTVSVLISQL